MNTQELWVTAAVTTERGEPILRLVHDGVRVVLPVKAATRAAFAAWLDCHPGRALNVLGVWVEWSAGPTVLCKPVGDLAGRVDVENVDPEDAKTVKRLLRGPSPAGRTLKA